MKPITNFFFNALTFAVDLNDNQAQFNFPDLPSIRGRKVQGIQYAGVGPTTWTDGRPVIPIANANRLLVTIQDRQSFNFVDRVPLSFFDSITRSNGWKYFLPARQVYWEACYLTIPQGTALLAVPNYVALFTAFYE